MRPALKLAAFTTLLAVAVLVWQRDGGGTRQYRVELANAAGLLVDDEVRMGGVEVGSVERLDVTPQTTVVATIRLRDDAGVLGRDARADVRAANLFGGKFLDLRAGNRAAPLAGGGTIPRARTGAPVEIDQVLDTLDSSTRARLATLIDQAGIGLAGRGEDLAAALADLPPTLRQSAQLLGQLGDDTARLGRVVERSDRVVATFARQRRALGALVTTAEAALREPGARPAAVAGTLREAAPLLQQLDRSLLQLRAAAEPLGPAARDLGLSAGPLRDTLVELPGVARAATPALASLRRAAPQLRSLARTSAPVLRRARRSVASLATFARDLDPVTQILAKDGRGAIGVLQGWARATQVADSLSHVFRGEFVFSPAALTSIFTPPGRVKQLQPRPARRPAHRPASPPTPTAEPRPRPTEPLKPVQDVVDQTTSAVGGLLDYLLGKP